MAKNTIETIKNIETKAEKIIADAKHQAAILLKKTQEQHGQELVVAETEAKQMKTKLMNEAAQAANKESEEISAANNQAIAALKKKVTPQLDSAKKGILKCLS
ncbi:MAG: hypothetical protein ABH823_02245 [bacterium]